MPSVLKTIARGTDVFVEKDKAFSQCSWQSPPGRSSRRLAAGASGLQSALIGDAPATYFKPPYVGSSGWIGIELDQS